MGKVAESGYMPCGYKVKPQSRAKIRSLAQDVLDLLKEQVPLDGYEVPIPRVLELLDSMEFIQLDIVEDEALDGDAGRVEPVPGGVPLLKVANSVYVAACDGDGFSRFTLAHELGHVFLHSRQPVLLSRSYVQQRNHKAFEDSEWQANQFAAELLMDMRVVRASCDDWMDVRRVFGVSEQAARIQWGNRNK